MKLFLDTNVVIDVIAAREPFVANSQTLLSICETGEATGIVSTLTFCTISYVLRKLLPPDIMRMKLHGFRNILEPIDLSTTLLDRAIASSITDFEDAVQYYSAVYCGADYIITRNVKHFPQTGIPVLTPTDFLALEK